MVKIIIGLVADISAGKDTFARYLAEKHGFERHTISDILRGEAAERGLPPIRENLRKIEQELRKKGGRTVLIQRIEKKFKKEKIVISGIRVVDEVSFLREKYPGKAKIVHLTADPKIRFQRVLARCRTGDPKTFEEFLKQEKTEWKEFDFKTLFKMADYKIENNGAVEELYHKIDELLAQVLK